MNFYGNTHGGKRRQDREVTKEGTEKERREEKKQGGGSNWEEMSSSHTDQCVFSHRYGTRLVCVCSVIIYVKLHSKERVSFSVCVYK